MNLKKTNIILFFVFLHLCSLFAQQEVVTELDYVYEVAKNAKTNRLKSVKNITDSIGLPFIDDFSRLNTFPDNSLWNSENVYINNHLAINPVTLGVATFDAIDSLGKMDNSIGFDQHYQGDVLTSKPFIINKSDKNIFLSFLYQPGGNGEPPDEGDSLILQFYSPDSMSWKTVWKAIHDVEDTLVVEIMNEDTTIWKPKGEKVLIENETDTFYIIPVSATISNFKYVIIPVDDPVYTKNNFKFRFINYYSINDEYFQGRISNSDMWHIDYVKMDANRNINDTIIKDIAFVGKIDSILRNYTSIPAKHFVSEKAKNEWTSKPTIYIKNNYDSIIKFDRTIILKNELEDESVTRVAKGDTIQELGSLWLSDYLSIDQQKMKNYLEDGTVDSAIFKFTYVVKAESKENNLSDRPENDTISQILELTNYYAYDDGSPEKGYGLQGQGTQNAKIAVQYEPYVNDTLKGVYIYFNRPLNDYQIYFYLTIWNKKNGHPGDTLYSREDITKFDDELYKEIPYKLDTPIFINGPFYIGLIQMKEDFLNIGFDTYRDNSANNYIDLGSGWTKSKMKGTLMIRPVFGKVPELVNIAQVYDDLNLNIYPNPVTDRLFIEQTGYQIKYSITDIQGRKLETGIVEDGNIDCSGLKKGIYIFSFQINGFIKHKKIIVAGTY